MKIYYVIPAMLALFSFSVIADQQCDAARERNIAPLREAAIQECIANPKKQRQDNLQEWCVQFYKDYGQRNPQLFWDLPECKQAFEARENKNPGK